MWVKSFGVSRDFLGTTDYLFVLLYMFPVTSSLCPVFFSGPCQLSHGLKTAWDTTDADALSQGLSVGRVKETREKQTERGVIDTEAARDTFTAAFKTNTCCRGWSAWGPSQILQSVTARLWLDNETELNRVTTLHLKSQLDILYENEETHNSSLRPGLQWRINTHKTLFARLPNSEIAFSRFTPVSFANSRIAQFALHWTTETFVSCEHRATIKSLEHTWKLKAFSNLQFVRSAQNQWMSWWTWCVLLGSVSFQTEFQAFLSGQKSIAKSYGSVHFFHWLDVSGGWEQESYTERRHYLPKYQEGNIHPC